MSTQTKVGVCGLSAVVLVIFYLVLLKPVITDETPSKGEIHAACVGLGTGTGLLIARWQVSPFLRAAAVIAAAMGYSQCPDWIGPAYGSHRSAPRD